MKSRYLITQLFLLCSFFSQLAWADITINAPEQVHVGETIHITWQGQSQSGDFITLVTKDTPEGRYQTYQYGNNQNKISLVAASKPGDYEIRYLSGTGYKTLARRSITLLPSNTTLEIPKSTQGGDTLRVKWSGPNSYGDFICIVAKGAKEGSYLKYTYTNTGNPLKLRVPIAPGEYEVRYASGNGYSTLASAPITVTGNTASVSAPTTARSGETVLVKWQGPNSYGDFILATPKGAKEGSYKTYTYTNSGNPLKLTLPEGSGEYEIRYASGDGYKTLASTNITLKSVTASMEVKESIYTDKYFTVEWQGPGNDRDYITIVKPDAKEGSWKNYTYTRWGNPLKIRAPKEAGNYELRYATGQSYSTLGRLPVTVLQSDDPGHLKVTAPLKTNTQTTSQDAVEIILDASGSMLKKQGEQRRIAIAKTALTHFIRHTLPDNTPLAIRAFGHIKAGSCDGELVLPLSPVNKANAIKTIQSIAPKNLAKTPIAASLASVRSDLNNTGTKRVILVTDGEETCKGDPEQTIKSLQNSGVDVQVNIIGFAIDDDGLKQTFQSWAALGKGRYFDAHNQKQLTEVIQEASGNTYQVINKAGEQISSGTVNGSSIPLPVGEYTVVLNGQKQTIRIIANQQSALSFP